MQHKTSNTPWTLYGIFLTFLAPIILAYSLFFAGYGSHSSINKGLLIPKPGISLAKELHKTKPLWRIALVNPQQTPPANQDTITKRWVALGKERHRVELITLLEQKNQAKDLPPWRNIPLSTNKMDVLNKIRSKHDQTCGYFLVDPNYNAILCYDLEVDPRDIDTDIRKLLKYSRSG